MNRIVRLQRLAGTAARILSLRPGRRIVRLCLVWMMTGLLITQSVLIAETQERPTRAADKPVANTPSRDKNNVKQNVNPVVTVSAASYEATAIAPDSIVAAFGTGLATSVEIASTVPLPTQLAGTTVKVKDSANVERLAQLFFVAPQQINYVIPTETMQGLATVIVQAGNGVISQGTVQVLKAAPALFTANASGEGVPAATILRLKPNNVLSDEELKQFDERLGRFVPKPIDLGPDGDRVFLVLYGSGIRRAAVPNADGNVNESVRVLIGGVETTPLFAGPAPGFIGLDQINSFEIPREWIGRGRMSLAVTAEGFGTSNSVEIEIAGPPNITPPTISGFSANSATAGETIQINGNGFAANPSDNLVRIGTTEATVTTGSATQLSVIVPFGAESSEVSVRTPLGEARSSSRLAVRTSLSGFVEDTRRQPLPGVTVRVVGTSISTMTNVEGAFILPNVAPGTARIEIDPGSSPLNLSHPQMRLTAQVRADRDNQFSRPIALQATTGMAIAIGTSSATALIANSPAEQSQTATISLTIPAGAAVQFPDGSSSGRITVTQIEGSRMPASMPEGQFSSAIAQITPFGAAINPGAKLTFPNPDGFPANSVVKLFRLDQTAGSQTVGSFVEAGTATVSADGQRIETTSDAIKETGIYFASSLRPVTAVIGHVVESDGRTPVRRVLVRARGRESFTDGNGGFIIRSVPVNMGDRILVEATYHRATGRIDRTNKENVQLKIGGASSAGELVLPARNANRPPAIFAPASVTVAAGQTLETGFTVSDPDAGQTVQTRVSGADFATVSCNGNLCTLRLAPAANLSGDFQLTLTATDSQNATALHAVTITVTFPPPTILSFSPTSASAGAMVTITGMALKAPTGETMVSFAGNGGTRIPAMVLSSSATEVRSSVPTGAANGPLEVITSAGRAFSQGAFVVTASQNFMVTISPASTTVPQGSTATFVVSLSSEQTQTFTQLAKLSVVGAPNGVNPVFEPAQITAQASSTLMLPLLSSTSVGSYSLTVRATALIDGTEQTRTATVNLTVQTAAQTMLLGRVLATTGDPLPGVTVSIAADGKSAVTDAAGNFLLTGVAAGTNRAVMVDGRTASVPSNRTYPVIVEPADITAGQVNRVPYTFYLPAIDTKNEVMVVPNVNTMVTTPMVRDISVMIPAGANLRNLDGSPVTRVSITGVEIDRTPAPLPTGLNIPMAFTNQPGGATSNMAMPVVYPNSTGANPGTRIELYNFNHKMVVWERYGFGRVSQDGRRIEPEIDPRTNKPYGLMDFSWHGAAPPRPPDTPREPKPKSCPPPPPGTCPTCSLNRSENPVDLTTGLKIESATDISFGGARGGLELTRIYTTGLAVNNVSGRFGLGAKDNYGIRLTGSFQPGGAGRLVMEEDDEGRLFSYLRIDTDGALVFNSSATVGQLGDVIRKLLSGNFEYRRINGEVMRFDSNGRLTAMVDRNGNTVTLNYSGNDLSRVTDAVGRSIRFEYANGRVARAIDPLERVWRYVYDGNNRLTTVADPLGNTTKYEYGDFNRLVAVIDKRGAVVKRISYDGARVSQQSFADGGVERYEYVVSGASITSVTVTDALGRKMTRRFNAAGYMIGETDALGQNTTVERDMSNNLPTKTAGPCNCTEEERTFDDRGNTVRMTDRLGQTTSFAYEPVFNNLTRMTDRLGRVTIYAYDVRGNREFMTDALGQVTRYEYDDFGQMTKMIDPLGLETRMEYDPLGNLTARIDALGNRTRMEYDAVGRLTAIVDPLGRRTAMEYDALDRVIRSTDASGATTKYGYDANGNQATMTDALGRTWTSIYDQKNNLIARLDPLGRVTRMEYDAEDQMTAMISPSGRTVRYSYDPRGQRLTMTDGIGGTVRFTYDYRRNLTALTDQRGNTTTFTYDEISRLVSRRDPVGNSTFMEYDLEGNLVKTIDRLGRTALVEYDDLNRRREVRYADATVTYRYDAGGRMMRIDDTQGGPIEWAYDNANRRLSEKTPVGLVSYKYNAASQRVEMTAADRSPVTYAYDAAGRLGTITQGTEVFTYAYDLLSRTESLQRPNRVKTEYRYDAVNRLERLSHTNAASVALEDFRYTYNADDEIASINSLASATLIAALKTAAPADAANRIPQFGAASYGFDSEGQTIAKTEAQGATNYVWDARGRLVRVNLPGSQTVSYGYDALGRRMSRTANGATTSFLYDSEDVVLDKASDGGMVEYVNGLGIDQKLELSSLSGRIYFLQDHLGSAVMLTNGLGGAVDRAQYEAFGKNANNLVTRYGFTGRERESASSLMHYRARWYEATEGRFISEDGLKMEADQITRRPLYLQSISQLEMFKDSSPVNVSDAMNLYAYVQNSPLSFVDSIGVGKSDFQLPKGCVSYFYYSFRCAKEGLECKEKLPCFSEDYNTEYAYESSRNIKECFGKIPSCKKMLESAVKCGYSPKGTTLR